MKVFIEHHGDRRTDPEESRDREVGDHPPLEVVETAPTAMSTAEDVISFAETRFGTVKFEIEGYGEMNLPNVSVVKAET